MTTVRLRYESAVNFRKIDVFLAIARAKPEFGAAIIDTKYSWYLNE